MFGNVFSADRFYMRPQERKKCNYLMHNEFAVLYYTRHSRWPTTIPIHSKHDSSCSHIDRIGELARHFREYLDVCSKFGINSTEPMHCAAPERKNEKTKCIYLFVNILIVHVRNKSFVPFVIKNKGIKSVASNAHSTTHNTMHVYSV